MDRRQFLAATLGLRLDPSSDAARGRIGAYLTPGYRATRLTAVAQADGVRVCAVPPEDPLTRSALAVHLYRYDRSPQTVRRLVLPWTRTCCGLYLRSSIPYALRQDLSPDGARTPALGGARRAGPHRGLPGISPGPSRVRPGGHCGRATPGA
jgi:hypothetical protein